MKRILVAFLLLLSLTIGGCAGINSGTVVDQASDIAFVSALTVHPEYRPAVVMALQGIKTFLSGSVTYDDLMAQIVKAFPAQYAPIGVLLAGFIETDKPVSTTLIPMLDSYKSAVLVKVNRFLLLSGA